MLRYLAAACQTDFPNPADRTAIPDRVGHMLGMIDRAVVGYRPFGDVRLVVFPEFGHTVHPFTKRSRELRATGLAAVPVPNEQYRTAITRRRANWASTCRRGVFWK